MSTTTIPTRQSDRWQEYAEASVTRQPMSAVRVRELLDAGRHKSLTVKDDVTLYRGRHRRPQQ